MMMAQATRQATDPVTEPACKGATPPLHRICFVCTGNTCRSPMAAAVFNHLAMSEATAAAQWLNLPDGDGNNRPVAISAGLEAAEGAPITDHAAKALDMAGIPSVPGNDYLHHTARTVDMTLLSDCDMIVGISRHHAMALILRFPELADRITAMPQDIPDPYGGDPDTYRTCLDALIDGVQTMFFAQPE